MTTPERNATVKMLRAKVKLLQKALAGDAARRREFVQAARAADKDVQAWQARAAAALNAQEHAELSLKTEREWHAEALARATAAESERDALRGENTRLNAVLDERTADWHERCARLTEAREENTRQVRWLRALVDRCVDSFALVHVDGCARRGANALDGKCRACVWYATVGEVRRSLPPVSDNAALCNPPREEDLRMRECDEDRVLREMASAPPVEGRDFEEMPLSEGERKAL